MSGWFHSWALTPTFPPPLRTEVVSQRHHFPSHCAYLALVCCVSKALSSDLSDCVYPEQIENWVQDSGVGCMLRIPGHLTHYGMSSPRTSVFRHRYAPPLNLGATFSSGLRDMRHPLCMRAVFWNSGASGDTSGNPIVPALPPHLHSTAAMPEPTPDYGTQLRRQGVRHTRHARHSRPEHSSLGSQPVNNHEASHDVT